MVRLLPRREQARHPMGSIADGQSYKVPSTIDDAAILDAIEEAVQAIGYGSGQKDS